MVYDTLQNKIPKKGGTIRDAINSFFEGTDATKTILKTATIIGLLYLSGFAYETIKKHGITGFIELMAVRTLKTVPGGNKVLEKHG